MKWFKRNAPVDDDKLNDGNAVEITAHKDANKRVVQQAKRANDQLNKLFEENGFTVKIVLAMGAKQTRGKPKI